MNPAPGTTGVADAQAEDVPMLNVTPVEIEVTDEDDTPAIVDDPWNYDFEGEDVQMLSLESSIAADDPKYNPELEPAPAVVQEEQQVSSSCTMLDDPPPLDARFLGFHLRPIEELTAASCSSFVEEIVWQSSESASDKGQLENALLFMSEVFGQAGRLLGRQSHDGKGKGKERAPQHIYFCISALFPNPAKSVVLSHLVCQV
jgi:hypothetical protein